MSKEEILKELNIVYYRFIDNIDLSNVIVIGKAAKVLLTNKDDPTIENIEVWVDPKYYDTILSRREYIETDSEDDLHTKCISFLFVCYEEKRGKIKLYKGDKTGIRPRSKKVNGFNVQHITSGRFKVVK